MRTRPSHVGPEYGAQYEDDSVAASYHLRPPYTQELFNTLAGLMPAGYGTILDLGCGTGDVSLGLLGVAERIDAVDPSRAMLDVARQRPSADDPRINWIRSTAEDFEFVGPYSLVVAGESLKWMDWEIVLPRIGQALEPNCFLAIVSGRNFVGVPWAEQLLSLIPRFSTNRDYQPLDLLKELTARELFREVGRHTTSEVACTQSVSDYVESIHTRNGFSRQRMEAVAQVKFDAAVMELVSLYAPGGVYHGVVQSEVVWGVPRWPGWGNLLRQLLRAGGRGGGTVWRITQLSACPPVRRRSLPAARPRSPSSRPRPLQVRLRIRRPRSTPQTRLAAY